ncbi:MAG TPA: adenylate/guanylate cyclase domain-containing protein [Fimbriimonas sp.]|nr:adenylate/guanylate cyclase domain-containing protein [Fimbriimonas sp.]
MTEKKRQTLLAYRDSLLVAYLISLSITFMTYRLGVVSAILLMLVIGFLFGTSFFFLNMIRDRIRIRWFALNFVIQTALTVLTILVTSGFAIWAGMSILGHVNPFYPGMLQAGQRVVREMPISPTAAIVVATLASGLINGFFAIDRKMGPGVILNWMTGKYYNPREEERIFMFLDMKDSTTIAEKLGNLKFSSLIRDFFSDMTFPILECRGQVSHYIGDEAVLTWKPKAGLEDAKCAQLFFKMQAALEERRAHYVATYGFVPEFKAGLHIGQVVATEVGEVKSEIVFHGDVLNTAARIQGLCNEEGYPLLASAELANQLKMPKKPRLETRSLGTRHLKGKANELEVFAILEAERPSH